MIDMDNICNTTELIDYTQKKYISLFKAEEIEPVIREVLERTMKITESTEGFLSIVDEDSKTFNYFCIIIDIDGVGMTNKERPRVKIPIEKGSLISVPFLKKCMVISNDLSKDPRVRGKAFQDPDHPVIKSYLGIPLINNDRVIGQIGLSNNPKFTMKIIEKIFPLIYFFQNFVELARNNSGVSLSQELKVKVKTAELKDTFIASMSHEMRTPLNGIIGMSRLLSESSGLTTKQDKYVKVITDCSIQLLELVNDVLDFSKISAGDLTLHLNSFNLKNAIKSSVDVLQNRANEKGLEIRLKIEDNLPETVSGDSRRIKQILINLLSNAVKFTEKGWIEIRVKSEQDEGFRKKIIIDVEDTGIGIKKEDYEKIFSIFTKATNNKIYSYDNPGAGLGLAINRELCRLMDGEITVSSVFGSGSTFRAMIKIDDETNITNAIQLQTDLFKDKTVICVDDNMDNRMFLMDTLMPWGLHVIAFGSAQETIKYIQNNKHFDILIIDICMPGMNGIELAQNIRELGYIQPLIGLSSLGSRSGENWFDHFAIKPVSKSDLYNMIVASLKIKSPRILSNAEKKGKKIEIILAEDDHFNQVLFQEMLETLGYDKLKIVNNGKECVDEIKNNEYDICFMDIKMPIMDGMEATKLIKEFSTIPIIAVSASVLDSDRSLFQKAGMDGYIPKPIDKDKIEAILSSRF
jgi:signal transduction histidine kinase/DNA-binding response OmpR family regulator